VVGEYWSGAEDIGSWLDGVLTVTDQQIAAFDFPLRYKLKKVCDTPSYDLRTAHPDKRMTDAHGNAEFPAPPRGYCVYAPISD
jgi:hypothetical protein